LVPPHDEVRSLNKMLTFREIIDKERLVD
jgi:hypothetical protein